MELVRIPNFSDYYIDKDCTKVFSSKKRELKELAPNKIGKYKYFSLIHDTIPRKGGRKTSKKIFALGLHQISYITFIENDYLPNKWESVIEHLDDNQDNNLPYNLIKSTQRQNVLRYRLTKKEETSSKYIGVYWSKLMNKWGSRIQTGGKVYHLGFFDNEEDAYKEYLAMVKKNNLDDDGLDNRDN